MSEQRAMYMQQLPGGICFAHGPYKDTIGCPKWPACATDPQVEEYRKMASPASTPAEPTISPMGSEPRRAGSVIKHQKSDNRVDAAKPSAEMPTDPKPAEPLSAERPNELPVTFIAENDHLRIAMMMLEYPATCDACKSCAEYTKTALEHLTRLRQELARVADPMQTKAWEWDIATQELDKLGVPTTEGEDSLGLWGRIELLRALAAEKPTEKP
jgi:hypothetical protein